MNVKGYINHGRRLLNCPKCNSPLPADIGLGFTICPICWPDMLAWAFQPGEDGLFRRVPDPIARAIAIQRARDAGETYTAAFPDEIEKIEQILRVRPLPNMNWVPGETVSFLLAENEANQLPTGLKE